MATIEANIEFDADDEDTLRSRLAPKLAGNATMEEKGQDFDLKVFKAG